MDFNYIKAELNGIYFINSISNKYSFIIRNNILFLSRDRSSLFRLKKNNKNSYYIELSIYGNKKLGVSDNNKIKVHKIRKNNPINNNKVSWNIIEIAEHCYAIQNLFNLQFLRIINNSLRFMNINNINIFNNCNYSTKYIRYLFNFNKIFDVVTYTEINSKIIENEPIDIIMKYIDLTDKTLNRTGIKQIYKDKDNEELRYSLRSIFRYIPWVRKIFILMPNEKIKYAKSLDEIEDKIVYVKDKDLLGYDSANIQSFLFRLDKMEVFGVSKNFIYMEDDCFIGKPLKKTHFFYYDELKGKVYPSIITWGFNQMNKNEVLKKFIEFIKSKKSINAHSKKGFLFQRLNTEKFFVDNFDISIIRTLFTHNAISENIDDLKEIHSIANKYIYINETLYTKERNEFSLCHEHFYNLYQLNIKHRKVHPILSFYIPIEQIKIKQMNRPLFVINTGGNHIPLKRQYKLQKKILEKKFPLKNIFEIKSDKRNLLSIKSFIFILNIFILLKFIKIYIIIINQY